MQTIVILVNKQITFDSFKDKITYKTKLRQQYYFTTSPRPLTPYMEQILLAYGLHKETVAVIIMLFKNTKVKVRSPDADTD